MVNLKALRYWISKLFRVSDSTLLLMITFAVNPRPLFAIRQGDDRSVQHMRWCIQASQVVAAKRAANNVAR